MPKNILLTKMFGLIVSLFLFFSSSQVSAQTSMTPTGPYTASCNSCTYVDGIFNCKCKNSESQIVKSYLDLSGCDKIDSIAFIDGNLTCQTKATSQPLPPGGYKRLCHQCSMSDNILSCQCKNLAGVSVPSSLEIKSCYANPHIRAFNGKLSCPRGNISVSGSTILRDGIPWVPKLAVITSTNLTEPIRSGNTTCQKDINHVGKQHLIQFAKHQLNAEMMKKIKELGADSIRLTISQGGFDDKNSYEYDPNYLKFIKDKVRIARKIGLNVVLTLRKKVSSCSDDTNKMPDEVTKKTWKILAEAFAADNGILFELLNEPFNSEATTDPITNKLPLPLPDDQFIGWQASFNDLIQTVRYSKEGLETKNAIVVEGLAAGKIFDSRFMLTDPKKNLIYGIHVYFNARFPFGQAKYWDEGFGKFCRGEKDPVKIPVPCLITEWQDSGPWNLDSRAPDTTGCTPTSDPLKFIDYVVYNKWGLGAWGFDYQNTVMLKDGSAFTKYNAENPEWKTCSIESVWGNGEAVFNAYNGSCWGKGKDSDDPQCQRTGH